MNEREVENREKTRYTKSSFEWIKEMKVRLGELDMQVRSNGKGFTTQKEMGREVREIQISKCLVSEKQCKPIQCVLNLVLVLEHSNAKRQLVLEVQEINPDTYQEAEQQEH